MEYGGYLPLELRRGREYYSDLLPRYVTRYNCGRTALYAAIKSFPASRVWLPYFYCPSTRETVEKIDGIAICDYSLNDALLPDASPWREDDVVVLVNYYGLLGEALRQYVAGLRGKPYIILDNAQAFFSEPILDERVLNLYSCRKFIGVGDGAYLIGPEQKSFDFPRDVSSERCDFLLRSLECGTNSAYAQSAYNEQALGKERRQMSLLTQRVLMATDYEYIKQRRRENAAFVQQYMAPVQRLRLPLGDAVPYCYPLLLDQDIREWLIRERIYVPTLWKELICGTFSGTLEYRLSKYTVCMPVDQRYGTDNMKTICDIIYRCLDREK